MSFADDGPFVGPYDDMGPTLPGLPDEAERFLGAREILDRVASTALAGRDGEIGLHEVVLRIGASIPALYALAMGLEGVADPSLGAVSHRLESMSRLVGAVAQGLGPLDGMMLGELRRFPAAIAVDLDRALRHLGVDLDG